MTRALTHFFGSTDGYRTLARAQGVTDADDAALATLGFGSPRTQADFDALESQPCMAGRLLPSGRFAITRVFPGQPDVAGRQTVERRTLIIESQAWADLLACDLAATLAQASNWSRDRFAAGEAIDLDALQGDDLLPEPGDDERRLFDALLEAQRTGRCAVLPDDARWQRALLRLGSFLPRERAIGFGWGVGMWSVPAGVWLATLRPDAQPRQSAPARLEGDYLHAEEVRRLGRAEAATGARRARKPARTAPRRAPGPWWIGAVAALLLIGASLWFAFARTRPAERIPAATTPATTPVVTTTPRPVDPPAAHDAAPEPPPPVATASADPTPTPAEATPPASTPAVTPALPSGASSNTNVAARAESFGAGASRNNDFGSGPGPAEQPQAPPAKAADKATPPAVTPAPPPATPAVTPAIPPPPTESTPWDAEVELLKRSIDAAEGVRAFAAKGAPDIDATLEQAQKLVDVAKQIDQEARKLESSLRELFGNGSERKIYYADQAQPGTNKVEFGASSSFVAKIASGMVPADLARQVALLTARFEIAQAARELLNSPLGSAERVRKLLKDEENAGGWPAGAPYAGWMQRKPRAGVTSAEAERFMADQFAKHLTGLKGMSGLVAQLRRIAPAPPPATTPAPKTP